MARRFAILVVVLALASALAGATEVVKFKNGHTMVVRESRLEGDILYVTLQDGSVFGFPRDLVQGPPEASRRAYASGRRNVASSGGRGPRGTDLVGYKLRTGQSLVGQGRLSAQDATARHSRQVGYSRPTGGGRQDEALDRPSSHGTSIREVFERITGTRDPGRTGTAVASGEAPEAQVGPRAAMRPAPQTRGGRVTER